MLSCQTETCDVHWFESDQCGKEADGLSHPSCPVCHEFGNFEWYWDGPDAGKCIKCGPFRDGICIDCGGRVDTEL